MDFAPIEFDQALADQLERDRRAAIRWARMICDAEDCLVADTETTSLDDPEIIQIALVNFREEVVYSSLVRPTHLGRITQQAFSKHGLTDETLCHEQDWPHVAAELRDILRRLAPPVVLAYNSTFDNAALEFSSKRSEIRNPLPVLQCAMKPYSEYCGNWDPVRRSYTWQRLPGGDHSAAGDCLATVRLIKEMANHPVKL